MQQDIFKDIWGNNVVTGERHAEKPGLLAFINVFDALDIIYKHCKNKSSKIAIHCDIDVDGIGTGYILGKTIQNIFGIKPLYIINKDKEHGIKQKHVDFFAKNTIDLLLIVDSSCNEIEVIKQFNCDVVVIDHHELSTDNLIGDTSGENCRYIVVNNTIENSQDITNKWWVQKVKENTGKNIAKHDGDDRMSCGLVVYETLRIFCDALGMEKLLENLRLFQWVGMTLFTDVILLNNPRNQWYIENTVQSNETETTIHQMIGELTKFKTYLDKTTINYTIAPVINRAIRAGHSGDALTCCLYNPLGIGMLNKFREVQDKAIESGIQNIDTHQSYILKDLTNSDVHKNYSGVIASRLCGDFNKNVAVYTVADGIAEGSFRGRLPNVDYREVVLNYNQWSDAQGHKGAFGIKCRVEDINDIMAKLETVETTVSSQPLLTAGRINTENPGTYMIEDMEQFKKEGGIWKLGIGNSRVSSSEQIMITVSAADAQLVEQKGKLYLYNILGLTCKAFKPISKPVVNIYVEYSRQIDCYIK